MHNVLIHQNHNDQQLHIQLLRKKFLIYVEYIEIHLNYFSFYLLKIYLIIEVLLNQYLFYLKINIFEFHLIYYHLNKDVF